MKNAKDFRRGTAAILAMVALVLLQSLYLAASAGARNDAGADVNLIAEVKILDTFFNDLVQYDKKVAELSKKESIVHVEYDALKRLAENLKRRLPAVQSALRDSVRKLRDAGQLENIDQIVLTKIASPRFKDLVRTEGFKRPLMEAASGIANDAAQISQALEVLRNKVKAQVIERGFDPRADAVASRTVRVSYMTAPAMYTKSFRCSLAYLRYGLSGAFHDDPSRRAGLGLDCFCYGMGASCAEIFQ